VALCDAFVADTWAVSLGSQDCVCERNHEISEIAIEFAQVLAPQKSIPGPEPSKLWNEKRFFLELNDA
jgi:hypothetical protein